MSLYKSIGSSPTRAKRFARAIPSFANSHPLSSKFVVQALDWAALGKEIVVDLGGSHGELCVAIAKDHPDLSFVVQELVRTVQSVDKSILPPDIVNRIKFMEHDFFTERKMSRLMYIYTDKPSTTGQTNML